MKNILLASSSPRRVELLQHAGLRFEPLPINFPEDIETNSLDAFSSAGELAESNARKKLMYALSKISAYGIVLCADTVVAVEGEILGKPVNGDDAARMLGLLSGREHIVCTGVALTDTTSADVVSFHETTRVMFRELSPVEIRRYIATSEPFDKAGAYGIQEKASVFVESISGCYSNVVGLPVARLIEVLRDKMRLDVTRYWEEKK
ncbi:MAG: Maf family protein [bacterium]